MLLLSKESLVSSWQLAPSSSCEGAFFAVGVGDFSKAVLVSLSRSHMWLNVIKREDHPGGVSGATLIEFGLGIESPTEN